MGVDTTGTAGAGCSLAGCDAVVTPPAPLGSRRLPDHLRHDGQYPGSRRFSLHCNFAPAAVS
jgi:hypothetical protein